MKSWITHSPSGSIIVFVLIMIVSGIVPIIGVLIFFIWIWVSGLPLNQFGFTKPKSWVRTVIIGLMLGIILKLQFKAVVMPLMGAEPVNANFQFLEGNLVAFIFLSIFIIVSAGFGEEVIFRGFAFNRLEVWLGIRVHTKMIIVLISSLMFGIPHLYQGYYGIIHAFLVGIVMGTMYYLINKNLWLPIITHATYDIFAAYLIYMDYEEHVATYFF